MPSLLAGKVHLRHNAAKKPRSIMARNCLLAAKAARQTWYAGGERDLAKRL
jgi:hypothetical protein